MKSASIVLAGFFGVLVVACSSGGLGQSSSTVKLDQRCAKDADCPASFQCEIEVEQGKPQSYCVSHGKLEDGADGAVNGSCPPGTEPELENGQLSCKAHPEDGGLQADGGAQTDASMSNGCKSDLDCPQGMQCEIEIQNGVTSSACRPHKGK